MLRNVRERRKSGGFQLGSAIVADDAQGVPGRSVQLAFNPLKQNTIFSQHNGPRLAARTPLQFQSCEVPAVPSVASEASVFPSANPLSSATKSSKAQEPAAFGAAEPSKFAEMLDSSRRTSDRESAPRAKT